MRSLRTASTQSGSTLFTMTIKFLCPSGHRLQADPKDSGRRVGCPDCGHEVIVPNLEDLDESGLQQEDSATFTPVTVPPLPIPVPANEEQAYDTEPHSPARSRFVQIYRPDEEQSESLKGFASALGLMIAFSAVPVVVRFDSLAEAAWPRAVLVVAVVQACYLVWMMLVPDWSTIRVVMITFIGTAAVYATAITWISLAPPEEPLRFGLEGVRTRALQWCGCVLTLMLFGAYLAARTSSAWRRQLKREISKQGRPRPPSLSLDE